MGMDRRGKTKAPQLSEGLGNDGLAWSLVFAYLRIPVSLSVTLLVDVHHGAA